MYISAGRFLGIVLLTVAVTSVALGSIAHAVDEPAKLSEAELLEKFKTQGVQVKTITVADVRLDGKSIEYLELAFDKDSWQKSAHLIAALRELDRRLMLRLAGIECADDDFQAFHGWPNISGVLLSRCTVPAESWQHIASLPNLRELYASFGNCGDECLTAFAGHKNLRVVGLEGRAFTDASLVHLRRIPNIDLLHLRLHGFSEDGVRELFQVFANSLLNVSEPYFNVPVWKLDQSKEFVYLAPEGWVRSLLSRGSPHDIPMHTGKDGKPRNLIVSDQPLGGTLAELKAKYERDLPQALKDFQLESSELVSTTGVPDMVRIIHTNTMPGATVRQLNFIVEVGKRWYFVVGTVLPADGNIYDQLIEDFARSISVPFDKR